MGHCKVPGCEGTTEFDTGAQAVICTACGTVVNEDFLSHEWEGDVNGGSSLYFGPTTLKSLRRVGGGLVGQSSKEDRERRHMTAMDQFIITILTKLSCTGLAPRARTLFEQARSRRKYRWGKTSVLAAGACITIVLRENRKRALFTHLAPLIDVSPTALCRMFASICSLLNLSIPPFEPLSLLPILQDHITALVNSVNSPLPKALVEILRPLSPASVHRLASSLANLISQLDELAPHLGASASPMACAITILALEGQAACSLPSYPLLAKELGAKVSVSQSLVASHYRDILKILEQWLIEVPWLIGPNHPDNIKGNRKRKTSQRDIIAMGMKDIVQFREDIQISQKLRRMASPCFTPDDIADDSESSIESSQRSRSRKRKRGEEEADASNPSTALRITRHVRKPSLSEVDLASLSLLSPMHLLTNNDKRRRLDGGSSVRDTLQTRILTSSIFPSTSKPTRLQLLVERRGGADTITDDELFEENELESLMRNEDEVQKLREILHWEEESESATGVFSESSKSAASWDPDNMDMSFWENLGSDKNDNMDAQLSSDEQIIGQWKEASPFDDNFDTFLEEW